MKKHSRLTMFLAGMLAALLLTAVVFPASAKQLSETAQLFYSNIKIFIDGAELVPKDALGNVVEPFIINGTTYLPVRAVASAFGKDVLWDGETKSIYLGKPDMNAPDNYLDKIQYTSFGPINNSGTWSLYKIIGTITDFENTSYTNGLLFSAGNNGKCQITFPLNVKYNTIRGTIVIPQSIDSQGFKEYNQKNSASDQWVVKILCDDEVVQTINATATFPYDFEINVNGVLNISFEITNLNSDLGYPSFQLALTDLALYE